MFVVTGATGALGVEVVNNLLDVVPAADIAVCARNPRSAEVLAQRGVDVRHADYDDPRSLRESFADADRLLLISASGIEYQKRVLLHCNVVEAAVRTDVDHLYYTSLVHGKSSVAYVAKAHIDTERILKASGLTHTIIRNGIYAEAISSYLGQISHEEVTIPADGPVTWTSRQDLAAGIARLLVKGDHESQTVQLTGPTALTINEVVQLLNAIRNTRIRTRLVSLDEYVQTQVKAGKPLMWARHWATTYYAMQKGELATIDPLLRELLGRPLRTMQEFLQQGEFVPFG